MANIEINVSGPIFDGRDERIVSQAMFDAQYQVGSQALADWHAGLNASIKHPTPYYETQITVQKAQPDVVVHDRGIVYGPWLEGVGSRNKTTRFKGYHALRGAMAAVQGRVSAIAEKVIREKLGGG